TSLRDHHFPTPVQNYQFWQFAQSLRGPRSRPRPPPGPRRGPPRPPRPWGRPPRGRSPPRSGRSGRSGGAPLALTVSRLDSSRLKLGSPSFSSKLPPPSKVTVSSD